MPGLAANRLAKARRIADFLEERKLVDVAPTYSPAEWLELLAEAGEHGASEETLEVVLGLLEDRAEAKRAALEELRAALAGGATYPPGAAEHRLRDVGPPG
jgi:hypothetical protein